MHNIEYGTPEYYMRAAYNEYIERKEEVAEYAFIMINALKAIEYKTKSGGRNYKHVEDNIVSNNSAYIRRGRGCKWLEFYAKSNKRFMAPGGYCLTISLDNIESVDHLKNTIAAKIEKLEEDKKAAEEAAKIDFVTFIGSN